MGAENDVIVSVSNLEVIYHHACRALQGVSLTVREGQIFALIGANGAGKTTTLRAISGFFGSDHAEITQGYVCFLGQRINALAPYEIVKRGVALVPESNKIFETLTVEENLRVCLPTTKDKLPTLDVVNRYFPALLAKRRLLAGFLSGGERQMLAIGQALLCAPKLLMIDELSLGLSPLVFDRLVESLVQMNRDLHLTVLLVEQNAMAALDCADYAAIMENGRIVFEGTPHLLLNQEVVRRHYLGLREEGEDSYKEIKRSKGVTPWWC